MTRVLRCTLLFCCLAAPAAAAEFRVGAAVVDITPPLGYRMSGYFRERLATGTHDPLKAKALVMAQGEQKAALVFCDIVGIAPDVSRRARALAAKQTGIPVENIAIAATHSHTGPLYFGALREHFHNLAVAEHGKDPQETVDYPAQLAAKLAEAITTAHSALQPAGLQHGIGEETRLSFNRRFHMKNGTVRFNPGQLNPDIVRVAGPIDPDVGVLKFAAADGRSLASLVVFALHLDTVGGTLYSADYPKYMADALRPALGEGSVSLFGTGTCGDINHVDVTIKGRRSAEEIGTMLAETVRATLPKLSAAEPDLAVRSTKVDAPLQTYSAERIAEAREKMKLVGTRELPFLEQVENYKILALQLRHSKTIPLEVQVFRLSRDVALVTLPGEVFVELGLAIKRQSPFKTTLVVELTNDAPGYIPTRKAFAEGSYETVNSRVQPGNGERMAEAAVQLLKELHGES